MLNLTAWKCLVWLCTEILVNIFIDLLQNQKPAVCHGAGTGDILSLRICNSLSYIHCACRVDRIWEKYGKETGKFQKNWRVLVFLLLASSLPDLSLLYLLPTCGLCLWDQLGSTTWWSWSAPLLVSVCVGSEASLVGEEGKSLANSLGSIIPW